MCTHQKRKENREKKSSNKYQKNINQLLYG